MNQKYDVIIIGGGSVGSACARELSRYKLKLAVLEKAADVLCGTSARNSGVLHAGFNNKPGTLMAKYCVEGNAGFDKLAAELDIPYKRTGKLVVGFTDDDRVSLEKLKAQGEASHVPGLSIVEKPFIQEKLPFVKGEFALWSESTAILNPFIYTVALAENAAKNGVEYFFDSPVTAIEDDGHEYTVTAGGRTFKATYIINCAGLGADKISAMLGIDEYTIYPCKGEYYILDKRIGYMLPMPAYPVPNIKVGGLGIHITPSMEGNVFVGPSNEYIDDIDDYAAEKDVMDMLIADGSRIFPHLKREHFIRNFTGIRPKLVSKSEGGFHDFVIERRADIAPRAVNMVGIESPGLTSSVPLAKEAVRLLQQVLPMEENPYFDPCRKSIKCFRDASDEERARLIAEDPDYGEVICRCETVTKAEVLQAIRNPLGVHTMTGIKYRCRAMMGRCQGGYCQMRIAEMIMQETGCKPEEIRYNKTGAYVLTGRVR